MPSIVRCLTAAALAASLAMGLAATTSAQATTSLFAPETFNAWLDLRLAAADGERSWLKGGLGKLRAGNGTAGLVDAGLVWTPILYDDLTGHLAIVGQTGADAAQGVSEAYFKWKPVPVSSKRYAFRLGRMFLPVSLEHDGPGWTTTRTLTPSALNSWIGEEGLVAGVEAGAERRWDGQAIGLTAGLFMGGDTAGTILVYRGWAMHDIAAKADSALRLPDDTSGQGYRYVFTRQAERSKPGVEVDGRPGAYLRAEWRPRAPVAAHLFYFVNPGNPTVVRHGQYGWSTAFAEGGVVYRPADGVEVMAQALTGHTRMGAILNAGRHPADAVFDTVYVMATRTFGSGESVSGRVEYSRVTDRSLLDLDNNNERNCAVTLAWVKPVAEHLSIALEALHVASNRPARDIQFEAARQGQTQIQAALKFRL